jgi:DNA-3-methyladenine glycosylase II
LTATPAAKRLQRPTSCALELRPRPPFRLDLTVWALRRREQNAIDTWDGHTYRRALLVDGVPVELAVRQIGHPNDPYIEVVLGGRRGMRSTEDVARPALARLLGLDVDLSDFYARAARDRTLRPLVERYRGLKPPRFPTLFECLLNAVACQQLSLAAGLTLLSRLAAVAGPSNGTLHAFPAPTDVLRLRGPALRALGFSERKAETIRDLARAASDGELDLTVLEQLDDSAVTQALVQRRGIGRWSADYALLRGLGRLHVFPQHDVGALNGLQRFLTAADVGDDPQVALARWAPDAGMLYFHLLLRGLEQHGVFDNPEPG